MIRNKFLQNNLIYMVSVVLGGFLGYLFHFLVSRQITVAQYGELQSVTSIMMIDGVFFSAITYFLIKKSAVFSLHNDAAGQLHFVDFARKKFEPLILGFVAIYALFLPLIKNWLHLDSYLGLVLVGLSLVVAFYAAFFSNSLQGWNDFFAISVIGVLTALVKVVSGFALAIFSPTASSVVFSFLISAICGWLLAKLYFRKKWHGAEKPVADAAGWREKYFNGVSFRRSFAQMVFFSLGLAVVGNLDILLIKSVASSELVGFYGALSVLGKIILWLNFSIVSVIFPEACAVGYSGRPVSSKIVFESYGLMLLISVPAVAAYYLFPTFFVGVMFGPAYLGVASNLWIFGVMAFFFSLMLLESKLALARYAFKASLVLFCATAILAASIILRHNSIEVIAIAVSEAFFLGWLMMLALNLKYRFLARSA